MNAHLLKRIVPVIAIALLTACGSVYKTDYQYVPPNAARGKQCIEQCRQAKTMCRRFVVGEYDRCLLRQRNAARFRYDSYKEQRQTAGLEIDKSLESFADTSVCKQRDSNDCTDDYKACYELCGGKVVPVKRCVARCD